MILLITSINKSHWLCFPNIPRVWSLFPCPLSAHLAPLASLIWLQGPEDHPGSLPVLLPPAVAAFLLFVLLLSSGPLHWLCLRYSVHIHILTTLSLQSLDSNVTCEGDLPCLPSLKLQLLHTHILLISCSISPLSIYLLSYTMYFIFWICLLRL